MYLPYRAETYKHIDARLEGLSYAQTKSQVDPYRNYPMTQMDRQTAFQLYIVDFTRETTINLKCIGAIVITLFLP